MAISQQSAWPFPIQWARGFREEYSFRTEVIESRRGNEQRIAQRVNPRMTYDVDTFINVSNFPGAIQRLAENVGRQFYLPHPRNGGTSGVDRNPGSSNVQTSTGDVPDWAVTGERMFLVYGHDLEMVEIASVTGPDIINFTSTLAGTFPAGSKLYRAVLGRLREEGAIRAATNALGMANVEFEADPVEEWHYGWSASPSSTYNGAELLTLKHNWSGDLSLKFSQKFVNLNLQRGDVDRLFPSPYTTRATSVSYVLRNDDQLERLIGLFYRTRGKQKFFYAPSQINEFAPTGGLTDAATSFLVEGIEAFGQYDGSTVNKRIQIETKDGVTQQFGFTVTLSSPNTQIDLDAALVGDYDDADIKNIQMLNRVRFDNDTLSVEWLTEGVAQANATLVTLEDT